VLTPLGVGIAACLRIVSQNSYSTALLAGAMPERYWYLLTLGVEPTSQHQGLASAMLRPALVEADRLGIPCALGTENEANLLFYSQYGFAVVRAGQIPGGPRVWSMLRPPSSLPHTGPHTPVL